MVGDEETGNYKIEHHMLWDLVRCQGGSADPLLLDEIAQLHHQAFSDAEETLEVVKIHYRGLEDLDSLLLSYFKEGHGIGVVLVDLSGE